jgi:hypothetical protein
VAEGCRDPLIIWQEEQILLDGHHRLQICERHSLTYDVCEVSLPDLDAAKLWMIAHQLGRRNLTPEQMSYYRGEQYNLLKRQGKRTDITSPHSEEKLSNTSHVLAAQHKVGHATIERDGAYAAAVETLALTLGPAARQAILARDLPLTRKDVLGLAALASTSAEHAAVIKEALHGAEPGPTLQAMARAARCAICQRPLSDPTSVQRGIGPICAGHGNGQGRAGGAGSATGRTPAPLVLEPETPEPGAMTAPATWPQIAASGDFEYYTPKEVLDLVREVLGTIDLDPASCATAQSTVQARTYYTVEDDGLRQPWHGTVFCNPPYKMPEIARFCGKLIEELEAGHATAAILLVNAMTATDWFQTIGAQADALCFPDGKLHFTHATRDVSNGPCTGQALLYFGAEVERFRAVFGTLGLIMEVVHSRAPAPALPFAPGPARGPAAEAAPRARPAVTPGTVEAALLQAFHAAAPAGYRPKEAASAIGKPGGAVSGALQTLCYKGYLRKEEGVYVLAQPPVAEGAV